MKTQYKNTIQRILFGCICFLHIQACEDFVEIDPPRNEIVRETVFSNDETAIAAINGIYSEVIGGISGGTFAGLLEVATGLASDELEDITGSDTNIQFAANDILPDANSWIGTSFWNQFYVIINNANAVIEGLEENMQVTTALREQLTGEALFLRAFVHFYLVNLFGDIPYVTTTNVEANSRIGRTPAAEVYTQIIEDLQRARELLTDDFAFTSGERVRATKHAATALLARAYLYTEQWVEAEAEAGKLLQESGLFTLESDLNRIFLANSSEAILQLSTRNNIFTEGISGTATFFIITRPPRRGATFGSVGPSENLLTAFEPGDTRRDQWISIFTSGEGVWEFIHKYKNTWFNIIGPPEYTMLFRITEQYLIRAEARAHLGDIPGAQQDLNTIRNRAGLGDTSATDTASLLETIARERMVELFGENGHRWLDLKRTGRVNDVIGALKDTWQPTDALFPLPEEELLRNNNLTQNPGY